jgi:hypothetical protein
VSVDVGELVMHRAAMPHLAQEFQRGARSHQKNVVPIGCQPAVIST